MRSSTRLLSALVLSGSLGVAQDCQHVVDLAGTALTGGIAGNGLSQAGSLSSDGHWLAFASNASNLVVNDTNGQRDVFLKDLDTGEITLVSRSKASLFQPSQLGNAESTNPSISADGRLVAFESLATNLVSGDTNGVRDVFVVDVQTGDIERGSVGLFGTQANGFSHVAKLSSNGRYLTFQTGATNLVLFGDPNGFTDVYVRDLQVGITYPGSVTWDGQWGNGSSLFGQITPDGRYLVFYSEATNMSLFDTNSYSDIFVRDFVQDVTIIASVAPGGPFFPTPGNDDSTSPSISDNGRYVAFSSWADNLAGIDNNDRADIFLRDLVNNSTLLVSRAPGIIPLVGNSGSAQPEIARAGRYIVYQSNASNLVVGDANGFVQDVFVYDRVLNSTELVSTSHITGSPTAKDCRNPDISGDGLRVCFDSEWSNFAGSDFNQAQDTFVTWTDCFEPEVFCVAKTTSNGCVPSISWSGAAYGLAVGDFHISASNVINQKPGLLFYGLSGGAMIPFQGGTLCVQPPTRRSTLVLSGGNPPNLTDCSGRFDLDMNAFATGQLGGNPLVELLLSNQTITAQWWGRDPGFAAPNNTMLSNALTYTILY